MSHSRMPNAIYGRTEITNPGLRVLSPRLWYVLKTRSRRSTTYNWLPFITRRGISHRTFTLNKKCNMTRKQRTKYDNVMSKERTNTFFASSKCNAPRIQGCPIYGKIRFLRILIACFSLRTKKKIYGRIYGFFRDRGSLRKKADFWTNLRIFSYWVRLLPTPPPPTLDSRYVAHAEWTSSAAPSELFRLLPEIAGFFGIPIGQPCLYRAKCTIVPTVGVCP